MRATSLSLADPFGPAHGGTLRTRAFVNALHSAGIDTDVLFPGTPSTGSHSGAKNIGTAERLGWFGPLKRQFLPMPLTLGARDSELRRGLRGRSSDVFLISAQSHFQYRKYVDAPLWLDFMDLWSDVASREALFRRGPASVTARWQGRVLESSEVKTANQATWITAAGWADVEALKSRGVESEWIPTPLPDAMFSGSEIREDASRIAGFLANFNYWPNRDAFDFIRSDWAPRLRKLGWRVVVAGRASETLEVWPDEGIEIIGELEDLSDFYDNVAVTLAPIRLGGGIKVKVAESLAQGRPVIGTPEAFEGFPPSFSRFFSKVYRAEELDNGVLDHAFEIPRSSDLRAFRQEYLNSYVSANILGA